MEAQTLNRNDTDQNPYSNMRLPELIAVKERVEAELAGVKKIVSQIDEAVAERVAPEAGEARKLLSKEAGTITVVVEGIEVKQTITVKVDWDTDVLDEICSDLEMSGHNPADWVSYKLTVPEAKYKKMTAAIKNQFKPARTIKYSKPSIKLTEVSE